MGLLVVLYLSTFPVALLHNHHRFIQEVGILEIKINMKYCQVCTYLGQQKFKEIIFFDKVDFALVVFGYHISLAFDSVGYKHVLLQDLINKDPPSLRKGINLL